MLLTENEQGGIIPNINDDEPDIGYISAQGTATAHGDVAESHATAAVIRRQYPDMFAEKQSRPYPGSVRRAGGKGGNQHDE